jgi:heterodisulfide reductase subunit A
MNETAMSETSKNGESARDSQTAKYDALVIGGGIGGMESALKLGDMGYKVLLVEKESSVGGKMILLSKVFPTLDCASCISTPKMGATIHHPNITALTYSEVDGIRPLANGRFRATIRRKPRYVDEAACTGCRQCEMVCNVAVPDEFNADMVSRRAAHIPFPQAVPKKAVIQRAGTSPCTGACPAGIKSHGYVALVRSGRYEEAFQLVCEATPLVGSLGRACYAPCEGECTRGSLEGPLPIRRLKRFIADTHYAKGPTAVEVPPPNGKKVAIVGSGPAGLTAAWHLARKGYTVKIIEAASQPGGMLRLALPPYRLPNEVVDQDVGNVLAAGVEIVTNIRVENLDELKDFGYDAVLLAVGTHQSTKLRVPGEDLAGIMRAPEFLKAAKLGEPLEVRGKRVVVIGGGNVAMDAARTALRLQAASVQAISLESLQEMPAHPQEIQEAAAEGVVFRNSCGVREFAGDTSVQAVELIACVAVFDEEGRFSPKYGESQGSVPADLVIVAAGMRPDAGAFGLPINSSGTIQVNDKTLQTAVPWVFAAGDAVLGPSMITSAAGHGWRAAFMIDRYLQGKDLDPSELEPNLPVVDKTQVLARQSTYSMLPPLGPQSDIALAPGEFYPEEETMTEEEALYSASRCLDCGVCSECHQCVAVCPADCITLDTDKGSEMDVEVGAVVLATGFKLFPADAKPQYGYGRYKNVITGMQMDRLLAPTRPYNAVVRPGDGKIPESIACILCTGSRDETVGNPLCSKVCCMYSIKQNQLIMGALPLADVTVYYMDVRSVGKGYDEFYEQAKAMGANFVRGRISEIEEKEDGNLILHYEDIENGGTIAEAEHDLVVLAVGVQPNTEMGALFAEGGPSLDAYFYVGEADEDLNPGATDMPGVFVAGAAPGAKDIPDSILHAGAAVAQAAAHLEKVKVPV